MADEPGTERLHEYWVHGEGAAKVRWGEPGDFDRCVEHLSKFIADAKGYCNLAHHAALGIYPATHAKMINAGRSAAVAHDTEYRVGPGGWSHGWIRGGVHDGMAPEDKADRMSKNIAGHAFPAGADSAEALDAHRMAAKAHREAARLTSSPAAVEHHTEMARLHSAVAGGRMYASAAHKKMGLRSMTHTGAEYRAKYTAAQKQAMAAKGQAMKNASGEPSYPIADEADLSDAIRAVGRGDSSHDTIRKHIISRAKALGKSSMIPDNWNPDGSLQSGSGSNGDSDSRSVPDQAERRITPAAMEVRMASSGGTHIGGYAAVFGKLSRNLGGFVERVDPQAFNECRQEGWPGVRCRLNHDKNQLLGTTEGRTLALRVDNIGLDYEVEPPPSMRHVVEWVERGDISTSSFAFNCPAGGDEWRTTDQGYPMRTLVSVHLLDTAPVTENEAYADATVGLRSLAAAMDAPFEEVRQLAAEDELRRFFTRTDNRGPAKPKPPPVTGPAAMMRLMEKRRDPWADQDV